MGGVCHCFYIIAKSSIFIKRIRLIFTQKIFYPPPCILAIIIYNIILYIY
ncbi:hypothetical protein [Moraxella lacunata]